MKRPHVKADRPPKPKVLYDETYHSHALRIKDVCLPTLPSAAPGYVVDSAYIQRAGRVELEGRVLEFQDVRIYLREAPPAADTIDHQWRHREVPRKGRT